MSLSAKLKQLMQLESNAVGDPEAISVHGTAEWIAKGMDIELFQ
jgi:hypothetical protein